MKPRRATLLALALTLAMATSASAATTIGSSMPAFTGDTFSCPDPGGCTFVPTTIGGAPVVVPYDGVLVRWQARVPAGGSALGLQVLRPAPGGAFTAVAGVGGSPRADGTISTPTRLNVEAGDLIGVDLDETDEIGAVERPGFDSASHTFFPQLGGGEMRVPDLTESDDFEALFNATVEPDADGDGYGDDSQDGCPQVAQTHSSCTRPPSRVIVDAGPSASPGMPTLGSVLVGGTTTIRVSVEERPAWVANGVLNLALYPGITAVEAHGPTPCSVAASRIACPLGILAPGQVATVSAVVRGVTATGLTRFGSWNVPVARVDATVTTTGGTSRPTKSGFIRVLSTAPCGNEAMTARLPDPGSFAGDRLVGTASADTFSGLGGEDCLSGKGANDTLAGGTGDDRISGDAGNDRLRGEAGADRLVGGTGLDRLDGGSGNDSMDAVDRKRDLVRCGPGRDRARVDRVDSVVGCEGVTRVPAAKRRKR
jgi:hypothetical protein